MTYTMCKTIIEGGRYDKDDLMNKLDAFLLGNRLTEKQYAELVKMMDK